MEATRSWGVCRRTIHYIWADAKQQRSSKDDTSTTRSLNYEGNSIAKRYTIRRLARESNVSKSKVGRWVKTGAIRPHTNVIKPELTSANKLLRL
ncbi:hypothetical protein ACS0TY_008811 [Phlomoides rotata]